MVLVMCGLSEATASPICRSVRLVVRQQLAESGMTGCGPDQHTGEWVHVHVGSSSPRYVLQ